MSRGIPALVLGLLFWGPLPSAAVVGAGEPVPELGIETLVQAPEGAAADWKALRGKVVVLEYWATWCQPCVATIPHLNELARAFSDDVVFISITDEPADIVTAFLEAHAMEGWVGLDPDRSAFLPFDVGGIPDTMVVDREGRLAIDTNPHNLTSGLLEKVVRGQPVMVASPALGHIPDRPEDVGAFLYLVEIRPGRAMRPGDWITRPLEHSFEAHGAPLVLIMSAAWNVPEVLMEGSITLPYESYDVRVETGERAAYGWREPLQRAIEETFGLRVWKEVRPVEVAVLHTIDGLEHKMRPPKAMAGSFGPGSVDFDFGGPGQAAALLQSVLGQPVFDETGLGHEWGATLEWDPASRDSLVAAAREQLGLGLRFETRELEVLHYELREEPVPAP